MADKLGSAEDPGSIMALLERVAGIIDNVQACQTRMEERQLQLESSVKSIQSDVAKLTSDHTATSSTVDKLLEKTRKVSCNIKDVRVRVENQNLRVKKVEATQADLLAKNKFRVVIYQGESEVQTLGASPKEIKEEEGESGAAAAPAEIEPDKFELPPDSDEEYMVVEEADAASAKLKKGNVKRFDSFKAAFSRENMAKSRENLGTKVKGIGERIVSSERREKIRQSGERLKESIAKSVPAKLKKERTVAEGQEGAEGAAEGDAPVPPPKGRKGSPEKAYTETAVEATDEGKEAEAEVPMYDMKQLS